MNLKHKQLIISDRGCQQSERPTPIKNSKKNPTTLVILESQH
jgi:hypothetical protein